jgi:hypothetical protein
MDGSRFDALTKGLAARPSRRSLLAAWAVAAVAALAVGDAPDGVLARKRKRRKRRNDNRCKPTCVDRECGSNGCGGTCGECASGEVCSEGECVCAPVCAGRACGPDGCGNQCGSCRAGDACQDGACVCSAAGAPGPGDVCNSAGECCPYPDVERFCTRGDGPCSSFLAVCRYGLGGKCSGGCDCLGDLECRNGTCRCPGDRDYLGNGLCCGMGLTRCGDRCCAPGDCFCFPGSSCRCGTLPT